MSEKTIEIVREYHFDPKEVIAGLNGYYESDKRNSYITVRRYDVEGPAYLSTPIYLSALIEWLREDYDIFYRPGLIFDQVEAARNGIDGFAKAVNARAEYAESLSRNIEKSDINKLISDYCNKNDIIAPSPYFSDEACVEYLFSVVDLERKHRAAVGKQMVDDYEKDLLQFIYKRYADRTHLSKETITYNPPNICNTITKIISDYARSRTRVDILETRIKSIFDKYKTKFTVDDHVINGDPTTSFMLDCIGSWIASPVESRGKTRAEIENYKLSLKDYILRDINEHGYRYDGLQTKSIEEIVDWIITMATSDHSFIVLKDIYTTIASPVERLRYNGCDGPTVDHMKEYILRRFEGLRANTEYCLKKMAELDGCQKDLKILEEQQKWLIQQNSELATKVSTKDDEISRLKGLINEINKEEDGEWFKL